MATKTLEKKVRMLSRQVNSLKTFIIDSIVNQDEEGEYKPSFIRRIRKELKVRATFEYKKKGDLLRLLKRA